MLVLLVLATMLPSMALAETSEIIAEPSEVTAGDIEILEAILHDTIRPTAGQITYGETSTKSPPVVLVSRTIEIGSRENVFFKGFIGESVLRCAAHCFEDQLGPTASEELAASLTMRNVERFELVANSVDGAVLVSEAQLSEAVDLHREVARGFVRTSLPGYTNDGHALVYATYICGGLCGYGWLFLLQWLGESWQVVAVSMAWVS